MEIEQELLNRILYIGNEIPASLTKDTRPKFILLGWPQEFMDALGKPEADKKAANAPCPYCNRSINHPPDCPNNTDGPEEPPAFRAGDIVEFSPNASGKSFFGKIVEIDGNGRKAQVRYSTSGSVGVLLKDLRLLFPLSRVLKELKLPSGETVHCTPIGTVVKLKQEERAKSKPPVYGMVVVIDNSKYYPLYVLCWYPDWDTPWHCRYLRACDIGQIVWPMGESK